MAMMRGTKIVEPAQLRLIGSISVGEREAAVFRCTFFTDRRSPWKYATPRPMFPVIGILSMRVRMGFREAEGASGRLIIAGAH
ncbi:predicted protein [Botrytis cinerea T4]|uniref:Uncharacterized protein n=1 Tax=Botryotinia fuckeliana (strain T4) TaxID=999810 RepID=G2YVW1_BOTF4|nr:predicted protein [Botrytis cinerea T4]